MLRERTRNGLDAARKEGRTGGRGSKLEAQPSPAAGDAVLGGFRAEIRSRCGTAVQRSPRNRIAMTRSTSCRGWSLAFTIPSEYGGWWRIIDTSQWVNDGLDLLGPAMFSLTGHDDRLRMHCLLALVSCKPTKTGVSFTWEGAWEYDEMSGSGRVRLSTAPAGLCRETAAEAPDAARGPSGHAPTELSYQ